MYIGQRLRRLEDPRLLTGRGRFVGDLFRPGLLHAAVLRSPHAHALIRSIDLEPALRQPSVATALAFADIQAIAQPIPMRLSPLKELERALQYPLAHDKVRYVGEPVAILAAATRYQAEDALERVEVEYEPLPAVVEPRAALAAVAPALHDAVPDNTAARFLVEIDDVDAALRQAEVVLEEEFTIQRHTGAPLETRGLLAEYIASSGRLTVWGPTKVVHFNRSVLARLLGIPERNIRFVEPEVGGGFGVRGEFYPEDFLVPLLAVRLQRPVLWVEDRAEHLVATNHSRQQHHRVRLGARRDGTILSLDDELINDMGAYVRTHGATVPTMTAALLVGPYRIPSYRCAVSCVLTNKTPTGTYRGPGRFEAAFVRERVMDMLARKLDLDPAEVRRRNFIPASAMPCDVGTETLGVHVVYDSGDYARLLDRALERADYAALRDAAAEARKSGRLVGVGLGYFVEKTGLGPWEYARAELDGSGRLAVYSGCAAVGQGLETSLAQIAAEALGTRPQSIHVVHGDTDTVPEGVGGFASRGAVVAGSAVHQAATQLRERILQLASQRLEVAPSDLAIADSRVYVRGAPQRGFGFEELVQSSGRPDPAGWAEVAVFETDRMAYPYGVHLAMVEVDGETGQIRLLRYLIAYDVGRAINPTLVEGQLVGGAAQGLGGAMLEELAYDGDGQPLSTSFMDYLLPGAPEVPEMEVLVTEEAPSPLNPLGVKGAGEGGTVGVAAALANAVADALGVEVRSLPLSPYRVRELVGERKA